ncbi:MAG TPA: hypothetical protein VGI40_23100 [Pirellulaceae bacterium]
MDQNPLEQLVAGYFRRGQSVREVRFNHLPEPTAVVVVLDNGKEYPHAVDADDLGSLPEWLTKAQVYLLSKRACL